MVLARADRTDPPTRTLPETKGNSLSEPASDRPPALPTSTGADGTQAAGDNQPPPGAGAEANARVGPGATTNAGSTIKARRSSTSKRIHQKKRRLRRPTQYFRWYGDADRRYYRRGER